MSASKSTFSPRSLIQRLSKFYLKWFQIRHTQLEKGFIPRQNHIFSTHVVYGRDNLSSILWIDDTYAIRQSQRSLDNTTARIQVVSPATGDGTLDTSEDLESPRSRWNNYAVRIFSSSDIEVKTTVGRMIQTLRIKIHQTIIDYVHK